MATSSLHNSMNSLQNSPRSMNSSPRLPCDSIRTNQYPLPSKTFVSQEHSENVLKSLNLLRTEKLLCDGTIIANGRHYMVHRSVLASCSEYFKTIFTTGNRIHEILLQEVSSEGLEAILEYCYTSEITLTLDNVETILHATIHLNMKPVTELCVQYLQMAITTENAIDILLLADAIKFKSLLKFAQEYVIDNFVSVAESKQFDALTAEQFTWFLSQDRLAVQSELQLFKIAARWIQNDEKARYRYSAKIMRNVRFPLITSGDLVDHVQSHKFMMSDPDCHKYLIEALNYHLVPHRQHSMQSSRTKLRSTNDVILAVGGERGNHQVSNLILIFDEYHRLWKRLSMMPLKRVDHCIAVLNHFLYIIGGQELKLNGKDSIGTVHRYDPRFNTWLQICPMQQRRAFFVLEAAGGSLFAIGGKNEHGPLASVEYYRPEINEWRYVAPLESANYALAGCVHDQKVYITGGFTNRMFSNQLQVFDKDENQWDVLSPMQVPRGFHMMVSIRSQLYVMGGNHVNAYGDRVDVMSVESYNPESNNWTSLSPMLTGLSMSGVSVLDNKLYVIGGYNGLSRQRERDIQCYNCDDDEWDVVGELPEPLLRTACCTLTLPHHVFMGQKDSNSVMPRHNLGSHRSIQSRPSISGQSITTNMSRQSSKSSKR
uniref:LOW QUALITY PROTEIN: kelch-like protein 14-like n=1 Tax=Saccoglossus kowalevskii TaxID=10224 RepID=A0ABM0M097_SACKO|nr:PREDICTED: LOW QUALITY PROTEIN: kelch-like protein 14-like [Saccoglossus kowalevskii]